MFFLFIENNFCIQIVFLILVSPPSSPLRSFPHLFSRISYNVFIIFLTAWLLLSSRYPPRFEFSSFLPIKSSLFPNYSWRWAFPELSSPTRGHVTEERWFSFLQKLSNTWSSSASGEILYPPTCFHARTLSWAYISLVHLVTIAMNLCLISLLCSGETVFLKAPFSLALRLFSPFFHQVFSALGKWLSSQG